MSTHAAVVSTTSSAASGSGLTTAVVAAVIGAAALHAGWNALIKAGTDKPLDTVPVHVLAAVVALPLIAVVGLPPAAALPFLAASVVIHLGYYIALAGAYQHGDLGLTYPIMRGAALLLVAIGSVVALAESPTGVGWVGIAAITLGIGLVGLSDPGRAVNARRAIGFAVANAAVIALYTLVDGRGVRVTAEAGRPVASYVALLFALEAWPYAVLVWWQRGRRGRAAVLAHAKARWPVALVGAIASIGAYGIALWAMTRAPIASVAALRETSVLFAALFATWLLGERFGRQRAVGTLVIVAGIAALRLG